MRPLRAQTPIDVQPSSYLSTLTFGHLLLVALVQGITEFLPVSSSAHLVLIPVFTGWEDQGLSIDIAAHLGSLGAVAVYFRKDVSDLVHGLVVAACWQPDGNSRLALLLAVASVPTILVGALLISLNTGPFRSIEVVAWATLVGAIALFVADRMTLCPRNTHNMSIKHAVIIGLAQVLALIPGASRAGVTITAALLCGCERREAARFSMLLSIPIVLAAGAFSAFQVAVQGEAALTHAALTSAALAFAASYATITLMMEWLRRSSYMPFVVYRAILGIGLLWWLYGNDNFL